MLIDKLHALTLPRLAVIDVNATVQAAAFSLSRPGIGSLTTVKPLESLDISKVMSSV